MAVSERQLTIACVNLQCLLKVSMVVCCCMLLWYGRLPDHEKRRRCEMNGVFGKNSILILPECPPHTFPVLNLFRSSAGQ